MTLINFGKLTVVANHIVYIKFIEENEYEIMLSSGNTFKADEEIKEKIVEVFSGIE
jgi:hypothetical protein